MPAGVDIILVAVLLLLVGLLHHWKWKHLREARNRRRAERGPTPIDRLPRWARLPLLAALVLIGTVLRLVLD